jgi:tellurite resistance protein TerC
VSRLRHNLAAWQELNATGAPAEQRAAAYAKLAAAEQAVRALPEEYRALIHERQTLREMLAEAHAREAAQAPGPGRNPAAPPQAAETRI